jgi:ADP-ribose pyrophosphatase YjhB (NUDIX family)
MSWRRRLQPLITPLFHRWWAISRGLTLGVRGLVTDAEGRVLLLEHTYVAGWYLPGGGVEKGESAAQAIARELVEEVGVEPTGPMTLVSVHDNGRRHRNDHVLLFRVNAWRAVEATSRGEILRTGWFAPDALPDGATPGTRARIREAMFGEPADPRW